MTRTILLPLFAVVACAALLGPIGASATETKFKNITYLTKIEPTSSATGTWQRRGFCFFGNEVGIYLADGTFDMAQGKVEGKSTCTFEDGSAYSLTFTQDVEMQARGLQKFTNGRGEFLGGTGRFEGVKGALKYSGRSYTAWDYVTKGDAIVEGTADYTLSTTSTKPRG